jgi:hypothetical protein
VAIRFRKSFGLGKGMRLNVGKKSASIRVGGKNLGYTMGTAGRTVSGSIPGTGLGLTHRVRARKSASGFGIGILVIAGLVVATIIAINVLT